MSPEDKWLFPLKWLFLFLRTMGVSFWWLSFPALFGLLESTTRLARSPIPSRAEATLWSPGASDTPWRRETQICASAAVCLCVPVRVFVGTLLGVGWKPIGKPAFWWSRALFWWHMPKHGVGVRRSGLAGSATRALGCSRNI